MNFETVIGIEIHLQLNTKTKMFSSALNTSKDSPNSHVHVNDMGFPGTMPAVNKKAVELAIKACSALKMDINRILHFDRKNYFYADLPKGFQITQDKDPIGKNGIISIEVDGIKKNIGIERVHLEEDTAKQLHFDTYTLLDYNRCGIPLVEIVSKPDIRSGKEAAAYVEKLREILLYLNVSDCKMEEGSLRCDINISLRPYGQEQFGTKVEIKNLNSINNIEKAIEYERKRQQEMILKGIPVEMETRRFDETSKSTVLMRKKTTAVDYKYFTEDNILPIKLDDNWVNKIIAEMIELPDEKINRFMNDFSLSPYDAKVLCADRSIAEFYDEAVKYHPNYKIIANWIMGELMAHLNKNNLTLKDVPLSSKALAIMIQYVDQGKISSKQAKDVFAKLLLGNDDVDKIIKDMNISQISDETQLNKYIEEVLSQFPDSIKDYQEGKDRAFGFMIGQIMKKTKGQANPILLNKLLKDKLDSL